MIEAATRAHGEPTPRMRSWVDQNQRCVAAAVRLARARLGGPDAHDEREAALAALAAAEAAMPAPSAPEHIRAAFGLSRFEHELLMLCAAVELSSDVADACAALHGDARRRTPTFALALSALPEPHFSATCPDRPLRAHQLLTLRGDGLGDAALRIDERVLHALLGLSARDERLRALVCSVDAHDPPARLAAYIDEVHGALSATPRARVLLTGASADTCLTLAAAAVRRAGVEPLSLRRAETPLDLGERDLLATLLERELRLRETCLIVRCDDDDPAERAAATRALAQRLTRAVISVGSEGAATLEPGSVRIALPASDASAQRALWAEALAPYDDALREPVDALAREFRLPAEEIAALGDEHRLRLAAGLTLTHAGDDEHPLRGRVRALGRGRFSAIAEVMVPRARPEDLVLPPAQAEQVRQIAQHVRHRHTVVEAWGFGARDARGLGVTALFHGPSGTGKTLAAEVIAARLGLDLVRVDLSRVVSKYIGETEKNLGRVFDAAERGGVVLLFDEADALFGKRSDVKDSHDRYANIEVGYLLQRMEAFRGLAVLTTNLRQSLDSAFLRRLRFVVGFPFPDLAERAEIWRRVLPDAMPREDIDLSRLARLSVSGGHIRNIALHAAYAAAAEGAKVGMRHMLRAARDECQRLEKTVTFTEVGGWE